MRGQKATRGNKLSMPGGRVIISSGGFAPLGRGTCVVEVGETAGSG